MDARSLRTWIERAVPELLIGPSLVLLLATWPPADDPSTRYPSGDHAVLELYTRLAAEGRQLVGAYSRFDVHHPGPAYFYASVPLYELSGESYRGITLTAFALNALAILAVLMIMRRAGGALSFDLAALGLACFIAVRGPEWLLASWNPDVAVLSFGVALVALAAFVSGHVLFLPLAVVAGSFAVQAHGASWPALLALGLAALVTCAPRARVWAGLPPLLPGRRGPAWVCAALAAGVLWAPPLIEQLSPRGGNLGHLLRLGARGAGEHGLADALAAVSHGMASFAVPALGPQPLASPRAGLARLVAGLLLAGAVFAYLRARRGRDAFAVALALLSLIGLAAALLATRGISGVIYAYLVNWISMLGLAAFVVGGGALVHLVTRGCPPTGRARAAATAGLAAALVLLSVIAFREALSGGRPGPDASRTARRSERTRELALDVQRELATLGIRRPLVRTAAEVNPLSAAALVLALDKHGVALAIDALGPLALGGHLAADGREDGLMLIDDAERAPGAGADAPAARAGDLRVYLRPGAGRSPNSGQPAVR